MNKNDYDYETMIDGKPMKVFKHVVPSRATVFYIRKVGVTVTDSNIFSQVLHNDKGCALDWHGNRTNKEWYYFGKRHRFDGPAINRVKYNGEKTRIWYLYGNIIDQNEYKDWLKQMDMDMYRLTPEDKLLIGLKWNT